MSNIITTITTNFYPTSFDIEMPDDVPVFKITMDLAEMYSTLMKVKIDPKKLSIFCKRMNIVLQPNETLSSSGVWNGDYISVYYMPQSGK